MRASRGSKPGSPDLAARLAAQLEHVVKSSDRLVVGLSGGVDSVVLLDCLQRVARKLRVRVLALHVNHQLSPNAGRWSAFCRRLCRARGIPFASVKVTVEHGDSVEAAARAARYAVFRQQSADYIVLAQHQDDQVETLLLQLLRGAGVKGLAAMPLLRDEGGGRRAEELRAEGGGRRAEGKSKKSRRFDPSSLIPHPSILRPFLDVTRAEIEAYANARGLDWVEDESNQDIYYQRNFLRHEVLPVVARRFPAYRATIARAARHLAEAAELLDELAASDGARYVENGTLAVEALRRLPAARARNLLRYFLATRGVSMPNVERLDEALRQALGAKQDAKVLVELDGAGMRRYAGKLHVVRGGRPLPPNYARRWRGQRELALPELGGVLIMTSGTGDGISLARLHGRPVTIRVRRGGERLQPDCRRPRRSLKNLLQEAGIPPWLRERQPLVYCGDELVWAAGIGTDCSFQAARGEAALRPGWMPLVPRA